VKWILGLLFAGFVVVKVIGYLTYVEPVYPVFLDNTNFTNLTLLGDVDSVVLFTAAAHVCKTCPEMYEPYLWLSLQASQRELATVIAFVDCELDRGICLDVGVRALPEIRYYTEATLPNGQVVKKDSEIQDKIDEILESPGKRCSNNNPESCTATQMDILSEAAALSPEARSSYIATALQQVEDAQKAFRDSMERLRKQHQEDQNKTVLLIEGIHAELELIRSVDATVVADVVEHEECTAETAACTDEFEDE
jgi:hypothetical protein